MAQLSAVHAMSCPGLAVLCVQTDSSLFSVLSTDSNSASGGCSFHHTFRYDPQNVTPICVHIFIHAFHFDPWPVVWSGPG